MVKQMVEHLASRVWIYDPLMQSAGLHRHPQCVHQMRVMP